MQGFTSHLNPTCVSSVDPPALKKQPPDPAIPSAVSHHFSVSLDSQKLPPITMTFLKFRFYPERRQGAKRSWWLENSAGMLSECKSQDPACSITPSVTFSFKCRTKSKDRLAIRRVELCTLHKMDKKNRHICYARLLGGLVFCQNTAAPGSRNSSPLLSVQTPHS